MKRDSVLSVLRREVPVTALLALGLLAILLLQDEGFGWLAEIFVGMELVLAALYSSPNLGRTTSTVVDSF